MLPNRGLLKGWAIFRMTDYDRPEGGHRIEAFRGQATATFTFNGKQVGQNRNERSGPMTFTASEAFDAGMDLGPPVALDYHRRAPFKFDGWINRVDIQ